MTSTKRFSDSGSQTSAAFEEQHLHTRHILSTCASCLEQEGFWACELSFPAQGKTLQALEHMKSTKLRAECMLQHDASCELTIPTRTNHQLQNTCRRLHRFLKHVHSPIRRETDLPKSCPSRAAFKTTHTSDPTRRRPVPVLLRGKFSQQAMLRWHCGGPSHCNAENVPLTSSRFYTKHGPSSLITNTLGATLSQSGSTLALHSLGTWAFWVGSAEPIQWIVILGAAWLVSSRMPREIAPCLQGACTLGIQEARALSWVLRL